MSNATVFSNRSHWEMVHQIVQKELLPVYW